MPYALRPVAELDVGDPILSYNHETGEVERHVVTHRFVRTSDHLRILELTARDGRRQVLETTDEHPFWLLDADEYVEAGDLEVGDRVLGADGEVQWITSSRYQPHPEGVTVYNVEVLGPHNYFVAAGGSRAPPVLSHNKCVYHRWGDGAEKLPDAQDLYKVLRPEFRPGTNVAAAIVEVNGQRLLSPVFRNNRLTLDPGNWTRK